ncbi:MAG: CAP domain-containing protein [bacterium]
MGKTRKKWLKYLLLGGILAKLFVWLFNTGRINALVDNFEDFAEKEKDQVDKLIKKDQSVGEFVQGSGSVFKDYFIPNDHNDHRPKILRPKPLMAIILILIVLKVSLIGYLFWIYPDRAEMSEQIAKQIIELTNQTRITNGLESYELNPKLSEAALAKAKDMLEQGYFAHHGPDGKKPWNWIDRGQYQYMLVGENLAMNFSSAQSAHNALMQSESHKKNILNDKYDDMGLAVVSGELNGELTNILVELFATTKSSSLAMSDDTEPDQKLEPKLVDNEQVSVLSAQTVKPQVKISPNILLETEPNQDIAWTSIADNTKAGKASKMIIISKYIYLIVLAVLIIALLVNIIIRISIQRKSVIIQSLIVIMLVSGMLLLRVHILESLLDKVAII